MIANIILPTIPTIAPNSACLKRSSFSIIKIPSFLNLSFYPTLMGSKTPTSKFSESKKFRWGSGCP
ncbi:hypothetical protein FPL01_14005 [Bacillus pacificus]|uniref:Uncharacterized protein n=1 Tax=Bacillus pacificus TaxID=2026187 RepID=A0ABX6I6W8_9BACI|nr:hypothetical protein COM56_25930 [Bacillus cereus]QHH89761.1 hypothetical protein FPL01_14005 [Bacillus pacificus]RRB08809.1 hypothetical protein EH195_04170 [Bacillus pacificus]